MTTELKLTDEQVEWLEKFMDTNKADLLDMDGLRLVFNNAKFCEAVMDRAVEKGYHYIGYIFIAGIYTCQIKKNPWDKNIIGYGQSRFTALLAALMKGEKK